MTCVPTDKNDQRHAVAYTFFRKKIQKEQYHNPLPLFGSRVWLLVDLVSKQKCVLGEIWPENLPKHVFEGTSTSARSRIHSRLRRPF
jgi:hypothetical protein